MRYIYLICFLYSLILSNNLLAQDAPKFNLWTGMKLEVKFSDKIKLKVQQHIRTELLIPKLDKALVNFEGDYGFKKWGWVSLGYRFTTEDNVLENRWYAGFGLKHTFKKLNLILKGRLRTQFDKPMLANTDLVTNIRLRKDLVYHPQSTALAKRFYFFLFGELWYEILPQKHNWNRYRIGIGTSYELSKQANIQLMYMFQNQISPKPTANVHMLLIQLGFKLATNKENVQPKT